MTRKTLQEIANELTAEGHKPVATKMGTINEKTLRFLKWYSQKYFEALEAGEKWREETDKKFGEGLSTPTPLLLPLRHLPRRLELIYLKAD